MSIIGEVYSDGGVVVMNQLVCEYRYRFNRTYLKLSRVEVLSGSKVYKSLIINDICYLIVRRNNRYRKGDRYVVKFWTGKVWRPISSRKNPRLAMNLIKEHAYDPYGLYV
ncbi:MAG: hypothetical protein ACRDD7_13000 [Peptostreptococcaceae bacterium]